MTVENDEESLATGSEAAAGDEIAEVAAAGEGASPEEAVCAKRGAVDSLSAEAESDAADRSEEPASSACSRARWKREESLQEIRATSEDDDWFREAEDIEGGEALPETGGVVVGA